MDARSLALALGGEAHGNNVLAPGPGHSKADRSLSVTLDPASPGGFVVNSFAGDDPIVCRDHVTKVGGMEPWKPNGHAHEHRKLGKPTYVFRYQGGVVCRWEYPDGSKKILPAVVTGDTWKWHAMPRPRPLYRLAELVSSPNRQVIIVEGEKKADALVKVLPNISVVSWAGGSESIRQSDWRPMLGRRVIIWPDNDAAGAKTVNDLGEVLTKAKAASIRYLPVAGEAKPAKWDAWDAIHNDGMDGAAIIVWAKERAREWTEPVPITTSLPTNKVTAAIPSAGDAPPYSDESLALTFAALNENLVRYVAHWARWKLWDGKRWTDDRTMVGYDRIREICRETAKAYTLSTKSGSGPKSLASAKTVNAVLALSRSDRRLAATVDEWDQQDGLLNTISGTFNLHTMQMKPHDPKDSITKMTAVAPGGDCPIWIKFLETITNGSLPLQLFLRRMCGYALTGLTIEHALFFLYGTGANGKSVFVNTIGGILGDYHITAPIETFTQSRGDRHPTEIAQLQGARLVTAVETEEGRRWAEARIKSLTGGDRQSARFMKQDFFEFDPKFKLIIAGNHKPGLRSVDEAIRRRFNLIPFAVTIAPADRDERMTEKLKAEWSGILQWMIGGCKEWQDLRGLKPPDVVTEATKDYLDAEDAIAAWIGECCDEVTTAVTGSRQLYGSWKAWATSAGEVPGSEKTFSLALEGRGYEKLARSAAGMRFKGLMLKPTDDQHGRYYDER